MGLLGGGLARRMMFASHYGFTDSPKGRGLLSGTEALSVPDRWYKVTISIRHQKAVVSRPPAEGRSLTMPGLRSEPAVLEFADNRYRARGVQSPRADN